MEHALEDEEVDYEHNGPETADEAAHARLYRWLEQKYPGVYVHDWEKVTHPQLGEVEVGGLEQAGRGAVQNPPPDLLAAEVEKVTDYSLALLATLPDVRVTHAAAQPTAPGQWRVVVELSNCGYLGTSCTAQALRVAAVRPHGTVSLALGPGQRLVHGQSVLETPHLSGRAVHYDSADPVGRGGSLTELTNSDSVRLAWVVAGECGPVAMRADFERGGVVDCTVECIMQQKL